MRKRSILVLLLSTFLTFNLTGCDAIESSTAAASPKSFTYISKKDLPAEYNDTGSYYYNKATGVVYVRFDRCIVKLESVDYEFYTYDKESNEFVGHNH